MNRDLSLAELYYGTNEPVASSRSLKAGRWTALFADGALRDIRCDGLEVIRSIAFLVRDCDWGTCSPDVHHLALVETGDTFRLTFRADCANPDGQRLSYEVALEGDTIKGIECTARCEAQTDFLTARTGFCVLHPIDGVAGAPTRVQHSDGTIETSRFPSKIDPWQPFKDVCSIEYRLATGQWASCALRGDTFEMEDQRNWSDASFKTYSRPLELPWPYLLAAGSTVEQSVTVSVHPDARESRGAGQHEGESSQASVIHARVGAVSRSEDNQVLNPLLGIAIAPHEVTDVLRNVDVFREIGAQRVSLHYDPLDGHNTDTLTHYRDLMRVLAVPATLEYALPGVGAPADELAQLARELDQSGLMLDALMISPSVHRQSNPPGSVSPPCPPLDEVYACAREAFPHLRLAGGMLSYFTELNRKRPPLERVDEVTHATCPIVHAADDVSVMQTLEAVTHITRSCRALIGTRPYSIGPLSIAMRQNPYGSRTMPNPENRRIAMADDDPRQRGLFGAAWLAGYCAAVSDAGLVALTLGALTGPRGIIDAQGRPYPIAVVTSALAAIGGRPRLQCESSAPTQVAVFGGRRADGAYVLVCANLTAHTQSVVLTVHPDLFHGTRSVERVLIDETTFADVRMGSARRCEDTLGDHVRVLKPFAVQVITF